MNTVIEKPIISEKSLTLASRGWYTFAVAPSASKGRIAEEIGTMFKVDVVNVRTITMHGKTRRVGRRMQAAKQQDWKKALVQLKAGQKIDIFEVTPQQEQQTAKA